MPAISHAQTENADSRRAIAQEIAVLMTTQEAVEQIVEITETINEVTLRIEREAAINADSSLTATQKTRMLSLYSSNPETLQRFIKKLTERIN